jgi:signal transduction histidine kinase
LHADDRDRVRNQFAEFAQSADPGGLDTSFRVITRTGAVTYVRTIASAHRDMLGKVTIRGMTIDVTEQRRLEMELQQAQKLESVGRLAAGVAHEINTPVQFVSDSVHFVSFGVNDLTKLIHDYRGLLQVEDIAALSERQTQIRDAESAADLDYLLDNLPKALNRALEGLERVATIVRSMKEFAHPDSRDMAPVDINRAIQNTLTVARNEYKYVAEVKTEFADIPMVTCHGGEVNQAVLNIVVNAAHAIEDRVRGTTDKGHISVRTQREGAFVTIAISDDGGGIPETIRGRIFDPFFTTKEVGKGTGQGLAIARSVIVDKHGGELSFESETGVGTTFIIKLPIENAEPAAVAA